MGIITSLRFGPKVANTLCQIVGVALLSLSIGPIGAEEPTLVRHYDKGYSPLLRVYLTDVLRSALDKTVPEFGPYEIQFYSQNLSSNRAKLETERGERLDILFSTHWHGHFVDQHNVLRVDFPIFQGMLGLRGLITMRELSSELSALTQRSDLLHYRAGLGANWTDIDIFKANNIEVIEAQLFNGLFPMLAIRRYDYLPLSVLEAQTALQTKGMHYEELVLNEDVFLFYSMPFYLYVNAKKPLLAQRLARGLEVAIKDGTVERLFRQHFFYLEPILQGSTKRLIVLQNPHLTPAENAQSLEQFMADYPRIFKVMP